MQFAVTDGQTLLVSDSFQHQFRLGVLFSFWLQFLFILLSRFLAQHQKLVHAHLLLLQQVFHLVIELVGFFFDQDMMQFDARLLGGGFQHLGLQVALGLGGAPLKQIRADSLAEFFKGLILSRALGKFVVQWGEIFLFDGFEGDAVVCFFASEVLITIVFGEGGGESTGTQTACWF